MTEQQTKAPMQYPVSAGSVVFFVPMLLLVVTGIIIGNIVQPFISGFVAGRKQCKKFWHFDDLEKE